MAVRYPLLVLIFDGIAIEKPGTGEAWKVLTVRVASENESSAGQQLNRLARIGVYDNLLDIVGVLTLGT